MGEIKGKRRVQRVEVKGDPYEFIARYTMSEAKDKVLRFLYDMRMAKVTQIQAHLGLSNRWTQQVLLDLYTHNFIYRKFESVRVGSSEGLYFLDTMGAFYLAMTNDMSRRDFPWSQRDNTVAPEKKQHTLSITEIRIVLEKAAAQRKDVQLTKFWGERRSGRRKFEFHKTAYEISVDGEIDFLIQTTEGKFLETVFIEYDSGFEDARLIKEKIERYDAYYGSAEFELSYQTLPDVIIICGNEISERRFKKVISESSKSPSKYWICSYDQLIKDPFGVEMVGMEGRKKAGIVQIAE